jgi:hypothetical protein
MYRKYFEHIPKIIGFSYWVYIIPMFILIFTESITYSTVSAYIPNEIMKVVVVENLNKVFAGFILGLLFLPYLWTDGLKFDFMGQPKYKKFSFMRFVLMIVIIPLFLGFLLEFIYPEFSYISAFIKFIEFSNTIIDFILTYIKIDYLTSVLPLIPIAIISFILVKYLIYSFIIFFIKYLWLMYELSMNLQP